MLAVVSSSDATGLKVIWASWSAVRISPVRMTRVPRRTVPYRGTPVMQIPARSASGAKSAAEKQYRELSSTWAP